MHCHLPGRYHASAIYWLEIWDPPPRGRMADRGLNGHRKGRRCVCVERAPCKLPWYFQFRNVDRSENCGCPFPRRPPTALRILYPARSRGRSRPAPQADARSSQVWCPSHTASPGCTLWCAPVPANGRTLTAAAANCRSIRCHTESVRPTSRRYCPLDPTALCGFTHHTRTKLQRVS